MVFGRTGIFCSIFLNSHLAFLLFIVCAFAETNRTPFDLPECETELVGGYHTEYSTMKLGFYLFSEYINMFVSSVQVMATLYFGGYNFRTHGFDGGVYSWPSYGGPLIGSAWWHYSPKIFFFIFFFMWVRWTIPRFPLRSVNGLRLESVDTTGNCQHSYYRNCYYFIKISDLNRWNHSSNKRRKIIESKPLNFLERILFASYISGDLPITMRHFWRKPVTMQYPEQTRELFMKNFRGLHSTQDAMRMAQSAVPPAVYVRYRARLGHYHDSR